MAELTAESATNKPKSAWGLRFSLRTLVLVMAAVAIYLGGRASVTHRYALAPALAGSWQMKLPAGFVKSTKIQDLGEGRFLLRSGGSVFNGLYEWRSGKLVMVRPDDEAMVGLVWAWDGKKLTLIEEPKNTPTGASYVGAVLDRPAQ
jgi:hypothetical protein